MNKSFGKSLLSVAIFALCALGFGACQKAVVKDVGGLSPENTAGKLAAVSADSVTWKETDTEFSVSWSSVRLAKSYQFDCNGYIAEVTGTTVNLRTQVGFEFPQNGEFTVSLIAKASGYTDSDKTTITYNAEGYDLESPEIKSFNNNILEWDPVGGASAYLLTVDGVAISDRTDGLYHATTCDLTPYRSSKTSVSIQLSAVGDGVYFKTSNKIAVKADFAANILRMLPVTDYEIENGVLKWSAVGGVSEYRVVDINRTVTRVTDTQYDMSDKNIVYGVFPVSDLSLIGDAEIEYVGIDYLEGAGTQASPYLIKTPFDLRAVDYYEAHYAEMTASGATAAKSVYRIENDIDYASIAALDDESNIYTLSQPFYGTLDGNGKTLSNVRVRYDGGYWALFDFITSGATVKNIKFDGANIVNELQSKDFPLNASVATVAYKNFGTISDITVSNADYTSSGGEVCGIALHNFGTVSGCTVSGKFTQADTGLSSQACYEMAGVVLENYGTVSSNKVTTLEISGSISSSTVAGGGYSYYSNVRTAAGIVAVNRAGGTVSNNSYETLKMTEMLNYYMGPGAYEYGGIVAYNAGTIVIGTGTTGTFTWSTSTKDGDKLNSPLIVSIAKQVGWQVSSGDVGAATDFRGTVCGKSDGTIR